MLRLLFTLCLFGSALAVSRGYAPPTDTLDAGGWLRAGDQAFHRSDYIGAARHYEAALADYSIQFDAANPLTARAAVKLAEATNALGDYPRAIRAFELALSLYGRLPGNWQQATANVYNGLGNSYANTDRIDEALAYYLEALALHKSLLNGTENTDSELRRALGTSYSNIGNLYSGRGDFDQALIYLRAALEAFEAAAQPLYVGMLYLNIGTTYERMGDYGQAMLYHQKSLRLFREHLPDDHVYLATAYANIGICLEREGYPTRAETHYRSSLAIYRQRFGEQHPRVADAYSYLGGAHLQRHDYARALDYHQRALDIRGTQVGGGHAPLADSYTQLGFTYQALRDYPTARDYFGRARRIYAAIYGPVNALHARAQRHISLTFYEQSEADSGLFYAARALESLDYSPGLPQPFVQVRSLPELLQVSALQSELYLMRYRQGQRLADLEAATQSAQRGMALVTYTKTRYVEPTSRSILQRDGFDLYETAIEIARERAARYADPTELERAFTYVERSNNALLADALRETEARRYAGIPDSLLARERALQADIIHYERQRFELLQRGGGIDVVRMNALTDALFETKNAAQRLVRQFEAAYPEYYALKYDDREFPLREVQERLLQPGQTLVEYFDGEEGLYAFVVRPDTFLLVPLEDPLYVHAQIELLSQSLYHYPRYYQQPEQADALYLNAAHTLYRQLIAPIEAHLTESLVIVPGGRLGYVPFDALLRTRPDRPAAFRDHDYLLRHYRISYAYSAALLSRMQHRGPSKAAQPFLGVAPGFTGGTAATRRLLHNRTEVLRLRERLGGRALLDSAATLAAFQALAGNYRLLHLATHGEANDEAGEYGYIAFAPTADSSLTSRLYVNALYNLRLDADLVVLSACESGSGEWQEGEGIIGMTRGLAYAGARSVLTTLWLVDDKASLRLMEAFYGELQRGLPKDEALRRARLHYLSDQPHRRAHPFFWAAYTPVGDMAPLDAPPAPAAARFRSAYWLVVGLLLFGVILIQGIRWLGWERSFG